VSINNGAQYMVFKKCGVVERAVRVYKKRGADAIT
jgi:hypothetical protein